jgi:hypothetical protein
MSSSDFYIAEEDDAKYSEVCSIHTNKNKKNTNVISAFSGLECPGKELHEWESYSKQYRDKFKKAKQCVQRRITTMKRFPARSNKNITSRKKHIYPIQVAYAYGQDCLKKIASKREQELFKDSVDELIKKVSRVQSNIQTQFGNSIENSIRGRENGNAISRILNRGYYNSNQMNLINKTRRLGYNKLSNDDKDLFLSIINEGISRNAKYAKELNAENTNENARAETPELINIIKKDIKKRRKTKKKSVVAPAKKTENLANLNEVLQSERFAITNSDRRAEFIKRVQELLKLYSEKILVDEKLYMLEDVYTESFKKMNKLNTNIVSILTRLAGQPITKKTAKKMGINEKYLNKYDAFTSRQKLGDDISKAHIKLKEKLDSTTEEIYKKIETGNTEIDGPLLEFYELDLPKYLLQEVDYKISTISNSERSRLLSEKEELYNLVIAIKKINEELSKAEYDLGQNLLKLAKAENLLTVNTIKSSPLLLKRTQDTIRELKDAGTALQKEALNKYKIKTTVIYDLLQQINKKYSNPYILKERLEKTIHYESLLSSVFNTFPAPRRASI